MGAFYSLMEGKRIVTGLLMAFSAALAVVAHAQENEGFDGERALGDGGIFSLTIENDAISNQDRHYTSGVRFAYLLPADEKLPLVERLFDTIIDRREEGTVRREMALGQKLYTPSELEAESYLPDDRPYAAWLFASAGSIRQLDRVIDIYELGLGVVGPAALGEETQDLIHDYIDSTMPQGWSNQLDNEVTLQYTQQRNWWLVQNQRFGGLRWDVLPHVTGSIGNVYTMVNGGVTFMAGSDRDRGLAAPRLGLTLPGHGYFEGGDSVFGWQVFGSVEGAAMGRNLFLDGNTFGDNKPSVVKKQLLGEIQYGIQFVWNRNRLSFVRIHRSKEFEGQNESETYGALSFSRAL